MHLWQDLSRFSPVCGMAVFEGQVSHLPALQQGEEISFRLCLFLYHSLSLILFVSQGWCDKTPPIRWLRPTETHWTTVLEAEVQNQGVGRAPLLWNWRGWVLPDLFQLLAAQEFLGWWLRHFPLYLVVSWPSSLCVPSSPKDFIYIGWRTTLPPCDLVLTNYNKSISK